MTERGSLGQAPLAKKKKEEKNHTPSMILKLRRILSRPTPLSMVMTGNNTEGKKKDSGLDPLASKQPSKGADSIMIPA